MSKPNPTSKEAIQNDLELEEQPEEKPKPAIPPCQLLDIKHVNYSKYFSEDGIFLKIINQKKVVKKLRYLQKEQNQNQ